MKLYHVRLVPELSGGVETNDGVVTIENGKICQVQKEAATQITPEDIDCHEMTLLPGLIDMHTHITLLSGIGADCVGEPLQMEVEAAAQAKRYLQHGFTTIRVCGAEYRVSNYVRDMIKRGIFTGPDILSAGNTLYTSVAMKDQPVAALNLFCDGPEAFTRQVRKEMAYGADFIKIYASGSAYNPTGAPQYPIMTGEEIRAAVEAAKMSGSYVAAHAHADSAIRSCIENGVRTIEHATYLGEETLELLLKTEDCILIPTFSAMYVSQTEPEARKFWLERLTPMLEKCGISIERAYRAGATIGFGTDSAPGSPMYENGVEFRYRKEYAKMNDLDILLQSTKINAEIAGLAKTKGQIVEGLDADLVLVDGKPDIDISAMYQRPEKVWKAGEIVK